MRTRFANVRTLASELGPTLLHVPAHPKQPAWGSYVQRRREEQGRSIRQAALMSAMSDAYWGQVERGYQTTADGGIRIIKPSRGKLIEIAETLRLSTRETNELLELAGYPPVDGTISRPDRGDYVDLTGLSKRDVSLLKAIADRLREDQAAVQPVRLRPVARKRNEKPPEGR